MDPQVAVGAELRPKQILEGTFVLGMVRPQSPPPPVRKSIYGVQSFLTLPPDHAPRDASPSVMAHNGDSTGPKLGSRGAFGPFSGVETTKSGGSNLGQVPAECDLSHVAQDTAKSWFWSTKCPKWGLGLAQWPKPDKHDLWYPQSWVSHRPKRSVGTSLVVTEGGFNPVGRDHTWVWHFCVSWAILRREVATDGSRLGVQGPNCRFDGVMQCYSPTKFCGCLDHRTGDTEIGLTSGSPACCL